MIACPGCDLAADDLWHAYVSGRPCPDCGLAGHVIEMVQLHRRVHVSPDSPWRCVQCRRINPSVPYPIGNGRAVCQGCCTR